MKLFFAAILLTLAVSCQCASNCHWGPSYWCKNEDTAKECLKTQYCTEKVWKTVVKGDKPLSLQCDICKAVVSFAQSELTKNSSESQVKAALEQLCSNFGSVSKVCDDLVDQYFDQIWQALIKGIDPDTICSQIGACTSTSKTRTTKGGLQSSIPCSVCTQVADAVIKLVKSNVTENDAKKEVEKLCPYIVGFASECRQLIDSLWDELWQAAISAVGDPHAICVKLNLCTSKTVRLQKKLSPKKADTIKCTMCTVVVGEIIKQIATNNTEDEAKAEVKKICPYLGGFESECYKLIDAFWDDLWKAAMSNVGNPQFICQKLSMCDQKMALVQGKTQFPEADACDICKLVVSVLKQYVESNSTEDEVKDAIEQVCNLLPGSLGQMCTSLIDQNFDTIWQLVKQELDSVDICKLLNLCTNTTKTFKKVKKMAPSDLCDTCKTVVGFLKPFVDSGSTENEVKSALGELCSILPANISQECTKLMNDYFDLAWSLLKAEIDTGDVCKQLKLCNSTSKVQARPKVPTQGLCDICHAVVHFMKPFVDNNNTQDEIKQALESFCGLLPGSLKDQCDALVDQYFDIIWAFLKTEVDSGQVCVLLGICPNATSSVFRPRTMVQKIQPKKVGGGVFCAVCEFVMEKLESLLDTNSTKQEIEDALNKVCSLLPSTVRNDCSQFVDKYSPEIIDLILSGTGARAVCTALTLCATKIQGKIQGVVECDVCKTVLQIAKHLMASQDAQKSVEEVLDDACKLMPSALHSECKLFVDTFGPQLIQLLTKVIDPQALCSDFKLCAKQAESVLMQPWVKLSRKY